MSRVSTIPLAFFYVTFLLGCGFVFAQEGGSRLTAKQVPEPLRFESIQLKGLFLGMSREALQSTLETFRNNHTKELRNFFIMSGVDAAGDPNQADEKVNTEIALLCPVNYVESRSWVELGCIITKPFFNRLPMVVGRVSEDRVDAISLKNIFFDSSMSKKSNVHEFFAILGDPVTLEGIFPVSYSWEQLVVKKDTNDDLGQAYCVLGGPNYLLSCTNQDLGFDLVITRTEVMIQKASAR